MASAAVKLLIGAILLKHIYGELSPNLNKEVLQRTLQTNKTGVPVDFALFRNFHKLNTRFLTNNGIQSNDIMAGNVMKTRSIGQYQFSNYYTAIRVGLGDQVVMTQVDEGKPGETKKIKYLVITNLPRKQVKEEQRKAQNSVGGILFRGQPLSTNGIYLKDNNLDEVVDFLLQVVRDGLHQTGRDQIVIPDVDEQFVANIVFIPVKGRFRAQDGWFRNISTIYRTGEVAVSTSRYEITVEFDLGLRTTQFGYRKYDAVLGAMEATGSLTGSVASDSIATKVRHREIT